MLRIALSLMIAAMVGAGVVPMASTGAPRALACTGGLSIEFAAGSSIIVVGDAIVVGDDVNRAPTVTPTATFTASPSPTRTPIFARGTAEPTPASPPNGDGATFPIGVSGTPEGFSLSGYGVTLRVVANYGGAHPELAGGAIVNVDAETRQGIERALREYEAGTGGISSCPIAAFVPKYTEGARYLVFAGHPDIPEAGWFTTYRVRVEGGDAVLGGPTIPASDAVALYMTAAQYHRYFAGVAAEVEDEYDYAHITADRVPLTSVLRYAASINGSAVRIAPPDTGSAGLLDPTAGG